MTEYDPADDGMKSYYAAIEAKRLRGDALLCPTCGKPHVEKLSRNERTMLGRLIKATEPMTGLQLLAGRFTSEGGPKGYIHKLRQKLKAHGFAIITETRKKGEYARYRLHPDQPADAKTRGAGIEYGTTRET